jgi:ABC-type transporter Mla maintaining outer membrane lipid asymmetry permease subunit MlaE
MHQFWQSVLLCAQKMALLFQLDQIFCAFLYKRLVGPIIAGLLFAGRGKTG